jgi:L-seryl-tRNA(Ser) seleniumtransferase
VPHLHITWDYQATGMMPRDVQLAMREGTPSIAVNPNVDDDLIIGVWMMEPGEDQIVADRLRDVLATV